MMRLLPCLASLFALLVTAALANTEKVIFIAPVSLASPEAGPRLPKLGLSSISSGQSTLQTAISVAFPSEDHKRGLDTWYLLSGLSEGQRYEVRVCWAATQPTEFWLSTYEIDQVFNTPELLQSLSDFTERRQEKVVDLTDQASSPRGSLLFLHVQAAADYFTTNKTLMRQPPLVDVDIILDRYLLKVFPESLVPTAIYILILAVLAFFVSGWIWDFLQSSSLVKTHQD